MANAAANWRLCITSWTLLWVALQEADATIDRGAWSLDYDATGSSPLTQRRK